jgi:uncharacterized protein
MLLDLSRFRGTLDRIERRFPAEAFAGDAPEDFRVAGPVGFEADVRKDGKKVRLVGRVRAMLETDCSRCLEPFQIPVDSRFDLLFLPASANTGDGNEEREVEDEDLGVSFYKDDVIDLREAIREQFYLALPMKPLCREDCEGLCPICGVNRNRATCDCDSTWVDPRMDALRKLKEKF